MNPDFDDDLDDDFVDDLNDLEIDNADLDNTDEERDDDEPVSGSLRGIRLPQPRPAEHLLMNKLVDASAKNVLCTTVGRGQLAGLLANLDSNRNVKCHTLDFYQAKAMVEYHSKICSNLEVVCEPDLPEGEFDLVAIPTAKSNEAELTRDLLQQGFERLAEGRTMYTAVDKPDDQWLHGEMKRLFPKVTRLQKRKGVVYSAVKKGPLKKVKNFDAEFAFRDDERLFKMMSRPSVFSHRKLDVGARALMNMMRVDEGDRVLDIGSGSGAVGIAAAVRAEGVTVHSIDSNPRAVQCTQHNAEQNNVTSLKAVLDCDGTSVRAGEYDLVLANPPISPTTGLQSCFWRLPKKPSNRTEPYFSSPKCPIGSSRIFQGGLPTLTKPRSRTTTFSKFTATQPVNRKRLSSNEQQISSFLVIRRRMNFVRLQQKEIHYDCSIDADGSGVFWSHALRNDGPRSHKNVGGESPDRDAAVFAGRLPGGQNFHTQPLYTRRRGRR